MNRPVLAHSRRVIFILIAVSLVSSGCISARRTPNLEHIFATARARSGKRPVIVIPGILGTELINPKTGETVWPSAFRTSQEGLPIGPDLAANRDDLVPGKIIETVKLARLLPEVYVYRDLLQALRRYAGYSDGDWANPGAGGYQGQFSTSFHMTGGRTTSVTLASSSDALLNSRRSCNVRISSLISSRIPWED